MENALQVLQKDEYPIELIFLDGEPLFNARQVGEGLMIPEFVVREALSDMDDKHKGLVTPCSIALALKPFQMTLEISRTGEGTTSESPEFT